VGQKLIHNNTLMGSSHSPNEFLDYIEDDECFYCFKVGPENLENEFNEILGSKREDRFSNIFLNWFQKRARFVFRTCLGTIIHVRACGHCKSSRRSVRR